MNFTPTEIAFLLGLTLGSTIATVVAGCLFTQNYEQGYRDGVLAEAYARGPALVGDEATELGTVA